MMELVIGTKAWSTWSLRPWLALKRTGAPFVETLVTLRREQETAKAIAKAGSPSGKIPVLKDGELTINDSLAICEYLAEKFPAAKLWPDDPAARALGRAAAAEMHAGFMALRRDLSMALGETHDLEVAEDAGADIFRVVTLWRGLLGRFGGPYLLGKTWSIADAFYTPVATRFRTYGVQLSAFGDDPGGTAAGYVALLLAEPDYRQWEAEALAG
jgi:glutathione S-transferase